MKNSARIGRAALAALFISYSSAGIAVAGASEAPFALTGNDETVLAQATVTAKVTDDVGVLDPGTVSELENKITEHQQETGELIQIVITDSSGSATDLAEQIRNSRGSNSAVYVIDLETRQTGVSVGADISSDAESLDDAAYSYLANEDYVGAANAFVDAVIDGTSGGSGSGAAWLAGGAGAIAVAGGGIWYATRRKNKKDSAETLSEAREIEPAATDELSRLPLETLETLAHEELVSTDESIRRGKEELDIATAEFGPDRTRPFTKAMNHSTTTLQKAFAMHQKLEQQSRTIPDSQRRQMLVEIVSSCGQADDALDAQAKDFADMRALLMNADNKLDELTQRSVDLRARLPRSTETLQQLQERYSAEVLDSIHENPEMAEVTISEAEKLIDAGRDLAAKPAGEQGGLVANIREAEHALEVTDRLLRGVENADSNIREAEDSLQPLIEEVEGEIAEAEELANQGKAQGTQGDWDSLEDLLTRSRTAVESARAEGSNDPLGQYTALTAIDTELDERLDRVREVTATHSRQLQLFSQQMNVAESNIQAAEDLVSSRGRLVGSQARTALADAQRLHAEARYTRDRDIRRALEISRQAANAAQTAVRRAQNDIDNYRRQQRRQQSASSAGNILTGMVIGQMLGGSSRGGFGGGFGSGGGFGGGGFGGGGGSTHGSAF
ncbi:Hypothetical protein NG00_01527 [Corynebacterium camporealensis]|uniref:TPM domain-containing protein n=1 Tax=Corynebacterium camporealensis TaxID=161896 RepID=A0A0F6TC25_9CORY|nr:TPM domain-containing protein [Corynebacterium camporealensis]AKE39636.1 protein of unknown function (DUF477) [Corynebacterium camporealensis]AVH88767.1 Hypothetical protein NG00_01527 [Corynebacterium camporealensis]